MGIREGMREGKDSFSKEKNWEIVICYGRFRYIALQSFTYTPLKKRKNKHGCKMLLCSSIMLQKSKIDQKICFEDHKSPQVKSSVYVKSIKGLWI